VKQGGVDGYMKYRGGGYAYRIEKYPELDNETGLGLDYGCGMVSVFEFSKLKVIACDPLIDEYKSMCKLGDNVVYLKNETEKLPFVDETFDWILNYNVIDHTPDPQLMEREMYRLLKPGGRLYFEVNFDDQLAPPHYELWERATVNKYFKDWKLDKEFTERDPSYPQTRFWAKFIK
jgi:SAM-dependent methyltransferase